jgi:hypothetical protein
MLLCVEFEKSVDACPDIRFFLTHLDLMLSLLFAHVFHAAVGEIIIDLLEVQLADPLVKLTELRRLN